MAKVGMSQNNVFPLSMPLNEKIALKSETVDELSRPSIAEAKKYGSRSSFNLE